MRTDCIRFEHIVDIHGKNKNASFGIETRTTAADSVLESFVPPTTASRGSGGRPVDDRLNSFIVQRVLQFYVDFLKMKAPKHWNERNINFALFSPEIPQKGTEQPIPIQRDRGNSQAEVVATAWTG
jgi:hypothetical protein